VADTFTLIAAERRRLADELDTLAPADWEQASLCEGWDAHTVLAHLNSPWSLGKIELVRDLVAARGNLDRAFDKAARDIAARTPPAECVAQLREHAGHRFVPPTMPPEAPLTDVILHGADLLRPLGRSVDVDREALVAVLAFLVGPKAKRGFRSASLDGLSFEATDLDWSWPAGPEPDPGSSEVSGPALSIAGLLVGRPDYAKDLTGDGVPVLVSRLA
jgi:uncharacterized protein (TIGR03083 family)